MPSRFCANPQRKNKPVTNMNGTRYLLEDADLVVTKLMVVVEVDKALVVFIKQYSVMQYQYSKCFIIVDY